MRLALAAMLLAACGGGSGGTITPATTLRTDLLYGYYGGCGSCALETQDHTNLYMTRPWGPPGWLMEVLPQLQQAMGNGQKVMLGLPGLYDAGGLEDAAHSITKLAEAGLMADVVALYPIDEPDVNGKSDAEVNAMNAALKDLMKGLGVNPALAVIYGCATGRTPGISTYDWIGCDDYGKGCDAATGLTFAVLKARLRPDQRLLLVPGGADPWRQDPACFASKAHSDPQVVAILPFLWVDYDGGAGIRTNPTRRLYCETGKVIKGLPATC